jgi:ABC-2 type transport system permease protein
MKLKSVIRKSIKEQRRQFWIFFLTVSMAPFFVVVYYLINESSQPQYDLLVLNQDRGLDVAEWHYGELLIEELGKIDTASLDLPLTITAVDDKAQAIQKLKNKKADALIILPEGFSQAVHGLIQGEGESSVLIELVGDLTHIDYMVSAVWMEELINEYITQATQIPRPVRISETSLGVSGERDEFDLYVPGILILSIIMLMFPASIALVTEVEHKTIVRLKLSQVGTLEFLTGVSIVQVFIGIISVGLTLLVAVALGFDLSGSIPLFVALVILTSLSIIAFSLIVAAYTRTVNEVLVVGNFPLFLFMFFTGAAFPVQGVVLFSVAGYPITLQGLMSPTHAISGVNKVLILNMGWKDILPEMVALVTLTIVYFGIGVIAFRRRHMRVE